MIKVNSRAVVLAAAALLFVIPGAVLAFRPVSAALLQRAVPSLFGPMQPDQLSAQLALRLTRFSFLGLAALCSGVLLILLTVAAPVRTGAVAGALARAVSTLSARATASLRTLERSDWWAIVAAGILAAVMRFGRSSSPILWDEATSYLDFIRGPWFQTLSYYPEPNNHVFSNLLSKASVDLFGTSILSIRLPVILSGICIVPVTYLVARNLSGRNAAILAAGLVAVHPWLVLYSTTARGYSTASLLLLLLWWCLTLRPTRTEALLAFGALGGVALWTVPTSLIGIVIVGLWWSAASHPGSALVTVRRVIDFMLAIAASATIALILYLPVFAVTGPRAFFANRYIVPLRLAEWPTAFVREFRVFAVPEWTAHAPLLLTLLLLLGVAIAFARADWGQRQLPPIGAALLALTFLSVSQRIVPPTRTLHFVLVVVLIAAGQGLAFLLGRASPARQKALLVGAGVLGVAWMYRSIRSPYIASLDVEEETVSSAPEFVSLLLAHPLGQHPTITSFVATNALRFEFSRRGMKDYPDRATIDTATALVVVTHKGNRRRTITAERVFREHRLLDRFAPAADGPFLTFDSLSATLYRRSPR